MRFGVRLPGPFFATFGRSAKSQAYRNLRVRAYEKQIIAEAPMRAARHRARVKLFWLAAAVVVPIALINAVGSALLGQYWALAWPVALLASIFTTIGYLIVKELRVLRSQRIGHKD